MRSDATSAASDDEASIQRVLAAVAAQMGAPLSSAQAATYRRLRRAVADRDAIAAAWTAELGARDQLLVQIARRGRGVPLPYPIADEGDT